MPYGTKGDMKPILGIDATDTTYDTELDECLTSAHNLVNSLAKSHGFSTPFSSPHQNVKDVERYVAAWLFRRRRAPPSEADVLFDMAMKLWNAYLQAEKEGDAEKNMRGCPFDDIFKRIVREVPLGYRWISKTQSFLRQCALADGQVMDQVFPDGRAVPSPWARGPLMVTAATAILAGA